MLVATTSELTYLNASGEGHMFGVGDRDPTRRQVTARTTGSTSVEMEALTAVQVGLLTLDDVVKALDPAMTIGPVRLLSKSGGRHGDWQRAEGLATG
jgi:molybdenum cofactor biosynthesis enzyme